MMAAPVPPSPDALAFREGMSRLGASVNLVTTDGAAGRHGLTVSAVCSVTDSPPTLLVCINKSAFSHAALLENGRLVVNVLDHRHRDLSRLFARWTGEERFADALWSVGRHGAPVLRDAPVAFECSIDQVLSQGSHSVLFCKVDATHLRDGRIGGLVWFARDFHGLQGPDHG